MQSLKTKVKDNFYNNPSIVYIPSAEHTIVDQGIEFNVKILESLSKKPESKKENFSAEATKKEEFNPFLPPFEDGLYIDDLMENHRLLYNKFSVCDQHVLLITKDFNP